MASGPPLEPEQLLAELSQLLIPVGGLTPEAHVLNYSSDVPAQHLLSIRLDSERWFPSFQLHADGRTRRADIAIIALELEGAMDDQDIIRWFASPNCALGEDTPLAHLRSNFDEVRQVARLDRFLLVG